MHPASGPLLSEASKPVSGRAVKAKTTGDVVATQLLMLSVLHRRAASPNTTSVRYWMALRISRRQCSKSLQQYSKSPRTATLALSSRPRQLRGTSTDLKVATRLGAIVQEKLPPNRSISECHAAPHRQFPTGPAFQDVQRDQRPALIFIVLASACSALGTISRSTPFVSVASILSASKSPDSVKSHSKSPTWYSW